MKDSSEPLAVLQRSHKDEAAFRCWYEATYPKLFYTALRLTQGNRAFAEDLCQEAVQVFMFEGGLAKVKTDADALAYLRRIIRNQFIDLWRRRGRETPIETLKEGEHAGPASDADSLADSLHAARQLYRLLADLKSLDQQILVMMLAGYALSEIASENDLTYSNAGIRVHRIRRKISNLMGDT